MADNKNEEQTREVMPASEKLSGPENEEKEVVPEKKEEAKSLEGQGQGLPEGTTDRTKEQFEKLTASNKQLKAQLDKLQAEIATQSPSVGYNVPQPKAAEFVDPATGEVDIDKLNKGLAEAVSQAQQARQEVRRMKEEAQEKEAYSTYPQLKPNAKGFDKELYQKTRALLLDSMINPQDYGGRTLTMKEAADKASGVSQTIVNKAKAEGAEDAIGQLTPKEQASLEATGRSDRRKSVGDLAGLQKRTRLGDLDAIVARMSNLKK